MPFRVVYLATQVFPERRVALKLLSSDLAADPAFRERFVRESNAAASTEHPNIVPVYGAGESEGQLYLAKRFIEGMDLRTLLEHEGTLSPERAARICAEVAEALEAAHERGLVHRDMKPGNVLLDGRDRAYLSDCRVCGSASTNATMGFMLASLAGRYLILSNIRHLKTWLANGNAAIPRRHSACRPPQRSGPATR